MAGLEDRRYLTIAEARKGAPQVPAASPFPPHPQPSRAPRSCCGLLCASTWCIESASDLTVPQPMCCLTTMRPIPGQSPDASPTSCFDLCMVPPVMLPYSTDFICACLRC